MMVKRTSRQTRGKKQDTPGRSGWVRREGIRLGAAVLVFALCYVGIKWIPAVKQQAAPFLQNILSCSCDFEEAVRCFSAELEQGNNVGDALEDFCVTAFAVQPTSASSVLEGEYSAFVNTVARSAPDRTENLRR